MIHKCDDCCTDEEETDADAEGTEAEWVSDAAQAPFTPSPTQPYPETPKETLERHAAQMRLAKKATGS